MVKLCPTPHPPRRSGWQGQKTRQEPAPSSNWLETWHVFVAISCRAQSSPVTAQAMLKYQSTICQLCSAYGPVPALKYDKLFRQATARTKDHTLHWDILKEDLLVWCVTNPPFRTRQQTHPLPSSCMVLQLVPASPPTPICWKVSHD